jgi:hypothetical protein
VSTNEGQGPFLARLAAANHLPLGEFRAYLGIPATRNGRPDLDRLTVLTGHSAERLVTMLAGAAPAPGRSNMSPAPPSREACRRCTASRGIDGEVRIFAYRRLCRRHHRWLGAPNDLGTEQYDLTALQDVVQAERRQHRLVHRYGRDAARSAVYWATRVSDRWTERGEWAEHRQQRLNRYLEVFPGYTDTATAMMPMLNYPEAVTLAGILISEHWSALGGSHRSPDRHRFDIEVARRLQIPYLSHRNDDPLVHWQEGEGVVRRRREQELVNYTGPIEVWLSQPT